MPNLPEFRDIVAALADADMVITVLPEGGFRQRTLKGDELPKHAFDNSAIQSGKFVMIPVSSPEESDLISYVIRDYAAITSGQSPLYPTYGQELIAIRHKKQLQSEDTKPTTEPLTDS